MSFTTDKQTLDDLNIFGKRGNNSIYAMYNHTSTRGGSLLLEQMFYYPLSDMDSINQRIEIIQFFKSTGAIFPFRSALFDSAEQYLDNTDNRNLLSKHENTLNRKFSNFIGSDTEYQFIHAGVSAVIEIVGNLRQFIQNLDFAVENTGYRHEVKQIRAVIDDPEMEALRTKVSGKLSFEKTAEFDKLIRTSQLQKIKKLLGYVYYLDVYISVGRVASERGFVFPKALDGSCNIIKLDGVYHPQLSKPVPNTLHITPDSNVVFLTGANMAGKSTFMKSLAIALFLAHMGFPVAAENMEFSVRDGIYTTINLPDNLSMGYSHFYAEVLRVKKVATQLSLSKNLFIVFDELFRGTNVKDAYEATVAITVAFAKKRNCMFVVSTHIIEAGDELKKRCGNINYTYLPTLMQDSKPVYTYQLETGITADRHGMIIINNEGIIDIIKSTPDRISNS